MIIYPDVAQHRFVSVKTNFVIRYCNPSITDLLPLERVRKKNIYLYMF